MDPRKDLAITILDLVEDVLEEHHIIVPDDDRPEDNTTPFYGYTYVDLLHRVMNILPMVKAKPSEFCGPRIKVPVRPEAQLKGGIFMGFSSQLVWAAARLDELLYGAAKAHCEYMVMTEDYIKELIFPELVRDARGNLLIPGDQYMVMIASNGYKYYVNVSGDSLLTACAEAMNLACRKF